MNLDLGRFVMASLGLRRVFGFVRTFSAAAANHEAHKGEGYLCVVLLHDDVVISPFEGLTTFYCLVISHNHFHFDELTIIVGIEDVGNNLVEM